MTQTYAAGQTLTAEAVNAELAFPTGAMLPYAGASAPTQTIGGVSAWLLCDGTAVSRTTYAALFTALGTTYGPGNGTTTFNLPDLRGRVPMGAGTGTGHGANGTGAPTGGTALAARARGQWGGDERLQAHTHSGTTGNDSPDHSHTSAADYRLAGGSGANYWFISDGSGAVVGPVTSTSGGASARHQHAFTTGAHSVTAQGTGDANGGANMQPYIVTNYLIKT